MSAAEDARVAVAREYLAKSKDLTRQLREGAGTGAKFDTGKAFQMWGALESAVGSLLEVIDEQAGQLAALTTEDVGCRNCGDILFLDGQWVHADVEGPYCEASLSSPVAVPSHDERQAAR